MPITINSPRRFTLTDRRPGPPLARTEEVLSQGWTTTDLLLEGAAQVLVCNGDSGFSLSELVDQVREIMRSHGIQFLGSTAHPERYRDDAERTVFGRFGDMHRAGIFQAIGGDAA